MYEYGSGKAHREQLGRFDPNYNKRRKLNRHPAIPFTVVSFGGIKIEGTSSIVPYVWHNPETGLDESAVETFDCYDAANAFRNALANKKTLQAHQAENNNRLG